MRVRISGQVNRWTSKTFVRTKGIGDYDNEIEWTNKTVEKPKGIGDSDSENECTSKWVDK